MTCNSSDITEHLLIDRNSRIKIIIYFFGCYIYPSLLFILKERTYEIASMLQTLNFDLHSTPELGTVGQVEQSVEVEKSVELEQSVEVEQLVQLE